MKKNLNVDAMILDLRNVQEDFLDRYEQIKLDCMIALTSPRVQTLLSQHNISLDSMLCKNVPEEVSVGVVNGKVTSGSHCASRFRSSAVGCETAFEICSNGSLASL